MLSYICSEKAEGDLNMQPNNLNSPLWWLGPVEKGGHQCCKGSGVVAM